MKLNFSEEVSAALHFDKPIVALESTVISHGLPFPQNLQVARKMEQIVRDTGAVPATIAVLEGEVTVGLNEEQLETLATAKGVRKVSRRDLPIVISNKENGATTVAATSLIAHAADIRVFATGGIGGVHRGNAGDISADLPELARTPIVVVCSGAKIVLDLPATREWLETYGIPVIGWQCDEMPAFYARTSGLKVDHRVENADGVARIAKERDELGFNNALVVTAPVPADAELPADEINAVLRDALSMAERQKVRGKDITPFLLSKMAEMSSGRTITANIALLENNARIGAEIAVRINQTG